MFKYLKNREYLFELASAALLTAILHYLALTHYLYWNIDWFDILMHFLGGVTMALLAMFIFFTSRYFPKFSEVRENKIVVFYVLMSFTLFIGLGWELWEIFYGLSDVLTDKLDTILDLIMDMVGALAVFLFEIQKFKKSHNNQT